MAKGEEQLVAAEIRPGVVWIRPGLRLYTVTDIIAGVVLLALLELLLGYWIVTMTSSRVWGLAAMGILLLVILLSARIVMHRNIKMTRRKLQEARAIIARAIEGDPEIDDAMLCAAIFARRRAHTVDVSMVRMGDVEKLEQRLSRRLPRVWLVSDEPVPIDCGFVPEPEEAKDSLLARRNGMPMYRQGEQIWASSPVVPMADQAGLTSVLVWITGLLVVMALALTGAGPGTLLLTIVGFIIVSMIWLARTNPAGYALAITPTTARIARRTVGSRLGRARELCPEDTLVVIRESPIPGIARAAKGAPPLVWRFVPDAPARTMPAAIEIQRFDPEHSPWWWVADQSWDEPEQVEPNA
jgi:hypothetical protein